MRCFHYGCLVVLLSWSRSYALVNESNRISGGFRSPSCRSGECLENVSLDRRIPTSRSEGTLPNIQLPRRHAVLGALGLVWGARHADAVSGAEAKIELPNPYQQMTDRASRQCLVESLGNRECLVFADEADKFLYKGADAVVLLKRIEQSIAAVESIPPYVDNKQWSKITGVLTGPMGDLLRTLNQVASLSEDSNAANERIKTIKLNLYAMNDAVSRKDATAIVKFNGMAKESLVAFVKAV